VAASAATSTRKVRKSAKKARKAAGKKRREFEKKASATAVQVKRSVGKKKKPRRWPWLVAVLAVAAGVSVLLRRKQQGDWTPAPAGDGPVPTYREDPVPTSPSTAGKTVSTAGDAPGDQTPPESDLGTQTAQSAEGDGTTGDDGQAPGAGGDRA
jgi:hypothetical protein